MPNPLAYVVIKEVGKKLVKEYAKKKAKKKVKKKAVSTADKQLKKAKIAAVTGTPTAVGAHVYGKKKRKELDKKLKNKRGN